MEKTENKTVEIIHGDGYTMTFKNELNIWKFYETWAAICGKLCGAEVKVTDIVRKSDGFHVPRKS